MTQTNLLFTYGTLRLAEVQLALFGHTIVGQEAVLPGYVRETIRIVDETVVGLSGSSEHAILRRTGRDADRIEGVAYRLSATELAAADAYETDAYARVEVTLASGEQAFVYARPEEAR